MKSIIMFFILFFLSNISSSCSTEILLSDIDIKVVAHRGFHGSLPENSIGSIKKAYIEDCGYSEIDIRQTADKQLVLAHGDLIEEMTRGKGFISKLKYSEVCQYTLINDLGELTNEKIPLLEHVFQEIGDSVHLMIELKVYDDVEFDSAIIDLLKKYNRLKTDFIISFDVNQLRRIRSYSSLALLGLIVGPDFDSFNDIVDIKLNLFDVHYTLLNNLVFFMKVEKLSVPVGVWTLNEIKYKDLLIRNNIEFITTDFPADWVDFQKDYNSKISGK